MEPEIVNRDLLPGNTCFGCGFENPYGLKVAITRDGDRTDQLIGTLDPPAHSIGFPGLTHGGVLYTALDCIAAWVPTVLRRETKAVWILRGAEVKYLKAAPQGERLALKATIIEEAGPWDAMRVAAEARNSAGEVVAEGVFKVIPLAAERFKAVAHVKTLPEGWQHLLEVGP